MQKSSLVFVLKKKKKNNWKCVSLIANVVVLLVRLCICLLMCGECRSINSTSMHCEGIRFMLTSINYVRLRMRLYLYIRIRTLAYIKALIPV